MAEKFEYYAIVTPTLMASLRDKGPYVWSAWTWILCHMEKDGTVSDLTAERLQANIGGDLEGYREALEYLCSPDPGNDYQAEQGRRLARFCGPYTWVTYVIHHAQYRWAWQRLRRLEYYREWERVHRPSGWQRTKARRARQEAGSNPVQVQNI